MRCVLAKKTYLGANTAHKNRWCRKMIRHNIINVNIRAEHVKKIIRARVLSACVPPFARQSKHKIRDTKDTRHEKFHKKMIRINCFDDY